MMVKNRRSLYLGMAGFGCDELFGSTVRFDPTLGEWLNQPGVGDWLTDYLQRLRLELSPKEACSTLSSVNINNEDAII